jgi:hypothetical protein
VSQPESVVLAAMLSEAKTLIELIGLAGGWLTSALQRAKKDSDRRAAQALHDAAILVAAMRSYDNALRRIVTEAMSFSSEWSDDRRMTVTDDLKEFVGQETILPQFRQALASLRCGDEDDFCEELTNLEMIAHHFYTYFVVLVETQKGFGRPIWPVMAALERGRHRHDVDEVRAWTESALALHDRAKVDLARADEAYGMLRNKILASHPLPEAGWAVSLTGT